MALLMLLLGGPHVSDYHIDVKELDSLRIVHCLWGLVLDGPIHSHLGPWVRTLRRVDNTWIQALNGSTTSDNQIIVGFLFCSLMVNMNGLRILHRFHC